MPQSPMDSILHSSALSRSWVSSTQISRVLSVFLGHGVSRGPLFVPHAQPTHTLTTLEMLCVNCVPLICTRILLPLNAPLVLVARHRIIPFLTLRVSMECATRTTRSLSRAFVTFAILPFSPPIKLESRVLHAIPVSTVAPLLPLVTFVLRGLIPTWALPRVRSVRQAHTQ